MKLDKLFERPKWWAREYYDGPKIDLSTNVCLDSELPQWTVLNDSYSDTAGCYRALADYHQAEVAQLVIGFGLSELIVRLMMFIKLNELSLKVCDLPTWAPVMALKQAFQIPDGDDVVYVAVPNGNSGQIGSTNARGTVFTIIDYAYADFAGLSPKDESNVVFLKTLSKSIARPGLRFGWGLGDKELIKELQDLRPAHIAVGDMARILPSILSEIPNHVGRMQETKGYLEERFGLSPSLGNFVLFDEMPYQLEAKVHSKEILGKRRMALTNLDLIKSLESESFS